MFKRFLFFIALFGLSNNQTSASQAMTRQEKIHHIANTTAVTFAFTGGITAMPVAYLLKDNTITKEEAVPVLVGWAFATGVGVSTNMCFQLAGNVLKYLKMPTIGNWFAGSKSKDGNLMPGYSFFLGSLAGILTFANCTLYKYS